MRYLDNHTGTHVYDTDSDQWYKFEDERERDAFLNYADSLITGEQSIEPGRMDLREDTHNDTYVEERGAQDYAAFTVLPTLQAFELLPFDMTRREARIKFNSTTGSVYVGRKELVNTQQPSGYLLNNGEKEVFETVQSIWVVGVGTLAAATLSILTLNNAPH